MTDVIQAVKTNDELHRLMCDWRHDFHQFPETAFEEFRTAEKIAEILSSFDGLVVHTKIAKTGVVGVLKGQISDNGKMIGLRADIDALDITEETQLDYDSKNPGKMHACGHDGHTTMLLGAAKYLSENPRFSGTVVFIFQPAEEGFGGGEVMCQEGLFERFPCDSVYGLHNWPKMPVGEFAVHQKEVMASTDSFDIIITGQGGHAAMPEQSIDPIVMGANLITSLQTVISRNIAPTDTGVITVTKMNAGSAYNIIPNQVKLSGTIRTFNTQVRDLIIDKMKRHIEHVCLAFGGKGEVIFHDSYPATINDPEHAKHCAKVVSRVVGESAVRLDEPPSMGAEDFSYMLQRKPGAYIWMGNGDSYGLHHPKYNFNDDVLPIGVNYWVNLAHSLLN